MDVSTCVTNQSYRVVEQLLETSQDVDINSAQYFFHDDQYFLVKLTKALFDDFKEGCSKFESSGGTINLLQIFHELCTESIAALRKLSLRDEKREVLSTVLQQLVNEQNAYSLLLKIHETDENIEELVSKSKNYHLIDMLLNDPEFRRMKVLLDWCEENAANDPNAVNELSREYANFDESCDIRQETRHCRLRGEKLCEMDLDGALRGHLHPQDEELQNRVHNVTYTLIRCGKLDEAATLMKRAGLAALVPSLLIRKMVRDCMLTPTSADQSKHYLSRSRSSFKRTVEHLINKGTSLSQIESCIWSTIAGRLEPTLSLCTRTDDRLWCLLNAAVEGRLDAVLNESNDSDSAHFTIDLIFDEIEKLDKSIYYAVYRFLACSDTHSLFSTLNIWLQTNSDELNQHPHILRFMAHIALFYRFADEEINVDYLNEILQNYVILLISMKHYAVIPYYASKLPEDIAENLLVTFMHKITDEETRITILQGVYETDINASNLCRKIFAYVTKCCIYSDETTLNDDDLISTWRWLIYPQTIPSSEALLGLNEILRHFFLNRKLNMARKLLDVTRSAIDGVLSGVKLEGKMATAIDHRLSNALIEYRSYFVYLKGLDRFDEWFKQSQKSLPVVPQRKEREWLSMDKQQKITFEVIEQKAIEQLESYKETTQLLFEEAVDALECILRFHDGWLVLDEDAVGNERTIGQLNEIRKKCLSEACCMLSAVFEKSGTQGSIQLVELLADEECGIAELIGKNRLRTLLKQLSIHCATNI